MALHYVLGVCVCENPKERLLLMYPFFQYLEIHYFASEIFTKASLDTDILYPTNLYYHNFNEEHFKSVLILPGDGHHHLFASTP